MPAETHVEKGPLDRQQVFELTRDLLADILEIEPSTITDVDGISWDAELIHQVGDYDAYGPFAGRDDDFTPF